MKILPKLQLSTLAAYIIFLIFYAKSNTINMRPFVTFSIDDMSQDIQYPIFFIFAGLLSFLRGLRILLDSEYTKHIVTTSPRWEGRLWGKVLGSEKAIKFYEFNAPLMIILAVIFIIFGVVLFFI